MVLSPIKFVLSFHGNGRGVAVVIMLLLSLFTSVVFVLRPIFSLWLGDIEGVKFNVAAPNETIDRTRSTEQNKQKKGKMKRGNGGIVMSN